MMHENIIGKPSPPFKAKNVKLEEITDTILDSLAYQKKQAPK